MHGPRISTAPLRAAQHPGNAPHANKTAAGIAADGRFSSKNRTDYFGYLNTDYFGYLNSGAAFSASLVVFIDASHLSFLLSWRMLTDDGDTAT